MQRYIFKLILIIRQYFYIALLLYSVINFLTVFLYNTNAKIRDKISASINTKTPALQAKLLALEQYRLFEL